MSQVLPIVLIFQLLTCPLWCAQSGCACAAGGLPAGPSAAPAPMDAAASGVACCAGCPEASPGVWLGRHGLGHDGPPCRPASPRQGFCQCICAGATAAGELDWDRAEAGPALDAHALPLTCQHGQGCRPTRIANGSPGGRDAASAAGVGAVGRERCLRYGVWLL